MSGKIVTDVIIARRLIKLGNQIIDIKPRHGNPIATVFVFQENEKFNSDLKQIIDDMKK